MANLPQNVHGQPRLVELICSFVTTDATTVLSSEEGERGAESAISVPVLFLTHSQTILVSGRTLERMLPYVKLGREQTEMLQIL